MFFQSFILMIGGFIAPYIRKITPRAALLGTLAGVSITFISMRPALEMYMTPVIGLICFAIILVSWFGGVQISEGHSGRPRRDRGRHADRLGLERCSASDYGGMSLQRLGDAFANFGFSVPLPAFGHVFSGFEFLGIILVTAIPFGIYDLVEAMDNVESAEAAGDAYPTTRVLTADGVVSLIGCLMGNPFINAVYIGHPGWKAMGGRIGYSAATGVMVIVLSWFGIISLMLALIPVVAISPILLYIGMLIGAQAFQTRRASHAPAIVLALTPHLAAWAKLQIDTCSGALAAHKRRRAGADKLGASRQRRLPRCRSRACSITGSKCWAAARSSPASCSARSACSSSSATSSKAAAFALAGAVLTFFGFMHGEAVGIGGGLGVTPAVALAYLVVAGGLFWLSKSAASESYSSHSEMPVAAPAE